MQASYLSGMLVVLQPCCSFPYYIDCMQSMSKINRSERSITFGGTTENAMQSDPRSRAWVEVDSQVIENNSRVLKKFIGKDCLLMAVVKADGYGTLINCLNLITVGALTSCLILCEASSSRLSALPLSIKTVARRHEVMFNGS